MKKLHKWASKVKPHAKSLKALRAFLEANGFEEFGQDANGSSRFYFINRKSRVVVKRMFNSDLPPPKMAVETVKVKTRRYYARDFGPAQMNIVVQPVVNTDHNRYVKYDEQGPYDLHEYNIGLYRNKLVAFDW
jgi:hypothetical protein